MAKRLKVVKMRPEVNRGAIGQIKEVLGFLESGEWIAVGVVGVMKCGGVATGWTDSSRGSFHQLLSGTVALQRRIDEDGCK